MKRHLAFVCLLAGACRFEETVASDDMESQYMHQGADWDCLRKGGSISRCVQLGSAQRMHGVWFTGFEESGFIPDVTSISLVRDVYPRGSEVGPELRTLLDIDAKAVMGKLGQPEIERCPRAFTIEFIGRRSVKPGPYYTGESDHVVVVDKLLSAKLLGKVRTRGLPGYDEQCASAEQATQ